MVASIDGLNSVSTLRMWLRLITNISGYEFKKTTVQIGFNNKTQKPIFSSSYDFNKLDFDNIQKVSILKCKLGLKGAIEAVYGSKEETQNKTNAQITTLNKEIQKLNTRLSKQKEELTTLYTHIGQLLLQINHIEDVIHSLPFGIGSKVKVKDGK